jgi:hypothetical protein
MDWDWLWMALVTGIPLFGFYGPRIFAFLGGLFTGHVTMMSNKNELDENIDRQK